MVGCMCSSVERRGEDIRTLCCWFFYAHMQQFCFLFTFYFVIQFTLNVSQFLPPPRLHKELGYNYI